MRLQSEGHYIQVLALSRDLLLSLSDLVCVQLLSKWYNHCSNTEEFGFLSQESHSKVSFWTNWYEVGEEGRSSGFPFPLWKILGMSDFATNRRLAERGARTVVKISLE